MSAGGQRRLLVGTAGTGTTWGILSALRERYGDAPYVLATDMAERRLVAGAALADAFAQVPAVADPAFADTVLALIAEHAIDAYLPTFDAEIVLAGTLRDAGRLDGVQLLAPPTWAAQVCWDKLRAAGWMAEQGLPTPGTARLDEATDADLPLCAKPRRGVGSVGVRIVRTPAELAALRTELDATTMIAQRLCDGPELTLDAFRGADGWTRAVCRERVEVKAGVSVKARVFEDDDLSALAAAVGAGLELTGAYCLQVMRHDDRWLVTDVNPRPGAGTRLAAAVGVDFQAALLAEAFGGDPRALLPRLERDRWVARQYREIVLD